MLTMTPSLICLPRFATPRTPDRPTFGGRIAKCAEVLGQPLMPWQHMVADVGGEVLEDGLPAYREVWVTVPRQNGKTTLVLAWELDRSLTWRLVPQRILYSAQNGAEAAKKLVNEQGPLVRRSPFKAALENVYRANGNEAIAWRNGSRIDILRDSESAGHGKTIDLAVIDEAFADVDDRREQALIPAMATRRDAQILGVSTAGTEASVYLRRKFDAGRAAVMSGATSGIAYFEWSADPDADPDDPETWRSCMPALGHTIDLGVVRHARATMTDGEFRRAFLNQWTSTEERVIPAALWAKVCPSPDIQPAGAIAFGLDVNEERSAASIVAADRDGNARLIDHRPGVGWVVDRVVELTEKHRGTVAVDGYGPAGALVADLEHRSVKVRSFTTSEFAKSCGSFYDDVVENRLRVASNALLDDAVAGANRKQVGDAWRWTRRGSSEVTPLVALTLAVRAARDTPPQFVPKRIR
jgi:hypothetical protein